MMSDSDFFDDAFGNEGKMEDDGAGDVTWWPGKNAQGGETLGGALVKGYYRDGYEGKGVDAVLIIKDRETGDLYSVGCGTRLLKDYVIELAPGVGTLIALQYDGTEIAEKSGHTFKKYIMRTDGEPDFEYWQKLYKEYHTKQQLGAVEAGFEATPDNRPDLEVPF